MPDVTKPHLRKRLECKDLGTGKTVRDFFGGEEDQSTAAKVRQAVRKNEREDRQNKA